LLATKPEDPIGHMIHILEEESGTASEPLTKEERRELKTLRETYKNLKKRVAKEEDKDS